MITKWYISWLQVSKQSSRVANMEYRLTLSQLYRTGFFVHDGTVLAHSWRHHNGSARDVNKFSPKRSTGCWRTNTKIALWGKAKGVFSFCFWGHISSSSSLFLCIGQECAWFVAVLCDLAERSKRHINNEEKHNYEYIFGDLRALGNDQQAIQDIPPMASILPLSPRPGHIWAHHIHDWMRSSPWIRADAYSSRRTTITLAVEIDRTCIAAEGSMPMEALCVINFGEMLRILAHHAVCHGDLRHKHPLLWFSFEHVSSTAFSLCPIILDYCAILPCDMHLRNTRCGRNAAFTGRTVGAISLSSQKGDYCMYVVYTTAIQNLNLSAGSDGHFRSW